MAKSDFAKRMASAAKVFDDGKEEVSWIVCLLIMLLFLC